MAESDLAPRNGNAGKQDNYTEDPFASPASVLSNSPTPPQPCAQPLYSSRLPRRADGNEGTNTRHDRYRQQTANTRYKPGSMSSTGDSAVMTPVSSVELEKASLTKENEPMRSSRDSKRSKGSRGNRGSRDPEKAFPGSGNNSNRPSNRGASNRVAYMEDDDEPDEGQRVQEQNAVKVLLFLSGPCVILSSINTAWACIALVITALTQPIRLCAKRPSFGQQLAGLLGPTLNLQLRCIYTPLPPYANEDASYHTFMLVMVHILSPFLSFVMMFAAWVLAVYWVSSAMVGDPAGQDKRDDGKETVLGLRRWWERWLMRSVKE